MKKNVVGHMMAEKEPILAKIRRWNIIPKLLCLLLALLIWLLVFHFETRYDRYDNMYSADGEGERTEWRA